MTHPINFQRMISNVEIVRFSILELSILDYQISSYGRLADLGFLGRPKSPDSVVNRVLLGTIPYRAIIGFVAVISIQRQY